MYVFVTGATGWVGAAVVEELLAHGHRVLGLSRSEEKGQALKAKGADTLLGTLDDLDALHAAATNADAVAHLGFNHDFSRYVENAAQDQRVIDRLGAALQGTDKPLLVSSTVSSLRVHGRVATETDLPASDPSYPRRSEEAARRLGERGVRAASVRLPSSVHGVGETHGFVPILINLARRTGVSAYIGDGANRWPADLPGFREAVVGNPPITPSARTGSYFGTLPRLSALSSVFPSNRALRPISVDSLGLWAKTCWRRAR